MLKKWALIFISVSLLLFQVFCYAADSTDLSLRPVATENKFPYYFSSDFRLDSVVHGGYIFATNLLGHFCATNPYEVILVNTNKNTTPGAPYAGSYLISLYTKIALGTATVTVKTRVETVVLPRTSREQIIYNDVDHVLEGKSGTTYVFNFPPKVMYLGKGEAVRIMVCLITDDASVNTYLMGGNITIKSQ